jgi:hypothetical protein
MEVKGVEPRLRKEIIVLGELNLELAQVHPKRILARDVINA